MKISVIIPFYNRSKEILRAVNSVLNQDIRDQQSDLEVSVLIVDDGSTEEGSKILRNLFAGNLDVSIVGYNPNKGANFARNYGVERSLTSDYVLFLDSDECLKENYLSTIYDKLKLGYDWICSAFEVYSKLGYKVAVIKDFNGVDIPRYILQDNGHLKTSCMIFATSLVAKVKWDVSLKRFQDLDLALRLFLAGYRVKYLPISLVICYKDAVNRISVGGGTLILDDFLTRYSGSIDNSLLNEYRFKRVPQMYVEEGRYLSALIFVFFDGTGSEVKFSKKVAKTGEIIFGIIIQLLKKLIRK